MKIKSVMTHSFSQVPKAQIPRSSFDRSSGFKTTLDSGYLVPVFIDEVLPGDTFNLRATMFGRLATPIVPVMDNLFINSFFFAVPIRLIWDNWQKFNGEQVDPGDSTDYLVPQMVSPTTTGYAVGSLSDYFGIPTGIEKLSHCSFWHRAYNLIWNEWFRDQNLQDSLVVDRDDGPDNPADYVLKRRGKRHDYFTSALLWPQKGPSVPLPLGSEAPIRGKMTYPAGTELVDDRIFVQNLPKTYWGTLANDVQGASNYAVGWPATPLWTTGDPQEYRLQQKGDHSGAETNVTGYNYADLADATASTINALRQAFQLQKLYERDARGGTRYTEIIRSHFGVVSPDARLQRPEYLGGGQSTISIHPVAQTAPTSVVTPQGNLAAFGTMSANGHGFTKSFTEHCVVMGLVSIRADLNYQQGLNRMFSRRTRWDYYWPALSHIGEQAVLRKEIYAQADDASGDPNSVVFGYQERYAEYRYRPSLITGKFRSTASGTLDIWHLAQKFTSAPVLDDTFIQDTPPVNRIMAVKTEPEFLLDAYFQLQCVRPMPTYSVPGLIDHF